MGRMALEHIRIIDLTQAWAGTYATQILADHGAEVIKVESRQRIESWRGGSSDGGVFPFVPNDIGPGERPHNRAYYANSVNRNKASITLDLTRERGRDIFRRLVRIADIVAENFTPHVMRNFGLDFDTLHALRPGLIMLSMPAYGDTGPYSEYPGNGVSVEPMSGNSYLLGYEGGPPTNSGIFYTDPIASIMGATAVLMALYHRELTGQGQHIDVSHQEAMASMLGYQIVSHSLTGETPQRVGNQDPVMAPHRNYRCQGDDQWVAIAARNDDDWRQLCQAMGKPDLIDDRRFKTSTARLEHRLAVDAHVEEWTLQRSAEEVEQKLLAAGVPVGKVLTMGEAQTCPHLNARDFLVTTDHREVGRRLTAGIPIRLSRSPGSIRRGPPCLGEHSAQVLREYLDISDEEIADLVAQGITGEDPIRPGASPDK